MYYWKLTIVPLFIFQVLQLHNDHMLYLINEWVDILKCDIILKIKILHQNSFQNFDGPINYTLNFALNLSLLATYVLF